MLLSSRHALYQLHLSTLDVLGNHHSFMESQSPESVPFLQHCCLLSCIISWETITRPSFAPRLTLACVC